MGRALTYAHARSPQLHSNTKVCSCTLLGAHLSVLVYALRRTLAPCAHPPHSRVSMGNGGEPPLVSVHPFVFVITKSVILFIRSLPPLFHLSNQVSPFSHLPVILMDQVIRRRNGFFLNNPFFESTCCWFEVEVRQELVGRGAPLMELFAPNVGTLTRLETSEPPAFAFFSTRRVLLPSCHG